MRKYLLFVGDNLADHDILVKDFVKAFRSSDEAMDYYDEQYKPDEQRYHNPALVAKYENEELVILYRTKFQFTTHTFEFRKNWLSAWSPVYGIWEGRDAPVAPSKGVA